MSAQAHENNALRRIYDEAKDKSDRRKMAEEALNELDEQSVVELALRALMGIFGDFAAAERPVLSLAKIKAKRSGKRSHSPRRRITITELLAIEWSVGGDKTKPIGDFTMIDHQRSTLFFKSQEYTAALRRTQHEALATELKSHHKLTTKELPEEILRQLLEG